MHDILELGDDLTLPEDQELFNKKVDEKLSACFVYDVVMGAFIARLYKSRKETPQKLTQLSSRSHPRGKKDSTKRHHHRHHKRQPGEQQFPKQVVTG